MRAFNRKLSHYAFVAAFVWQSVWGTSALANAPGSAPMCEQITISSPAAVSKAPTDTKGSPITAEPVHVFAAIPFKLEGTPEYPQLRKLYFEGARLNADSSALRKSLYFPANDVISGSAQEYKVTPLIKRLASYKHDLGTFAATASVAARADLRQQILIYFSTAADIIQCELFFDPYSIDSLNKYDGIFEITMPLAVYSDIFPSFMDEYDNIAYTRILDARRPAYRLTISHEAILTYLKRALARSNVTRNHQTSFFATVRCLLGDELIDRYVGNNLLLMRVPDSLPSEMQQPVCGMITAEDIFNMRLHNQVDGLYLQDERYALVSAFPSYVSLMSDADQKLFVETTKDKDGHTQRSLIDFAALMLSKKHDINQIKDSAKRAAAEKLYAKQFNRFAELSGQLYDQIPDNDALNSFFSDSQIKDGLRDTLGSCQDNGSFDKALNDFATAESIYYFVDPSIGDDLSAQLTGLDSVSYRQEIYQIIARQKIETLSEAAEFVFQKYLDTTPIDIAALTARFRIEVIEPAVKRIIANYEAKGTLDRYVNMVLNRRRSFYKPDFTMRMARLQYDQSAIIGANFVRYYLDPKAALTPKYLSSLPYSRSAIANYYSDKLNQISSLSRPVIRPFFQIQNLKDAHTAYAQIDQALKKDFVDNNYNVKYLSTPNWRQKIWGYITSPSTLISPNDAVQRPQEIKNDRAIFSEIAGAMGVNGDLKERQSLMDALFDQNPKWSTDEQAKFIQKYRQSLAEQYIGSVRILDMPQCMRVNDGSCSTPWSDKTPLYQSISDMYPDPSTLTPKSDETSSESTSRLNYVDNMISSALTASANNDIKDLHNLLTNYDQDLRPVVESATIVGSLLGQNELKNEILAGDLSQQLGVNLESFQSVDENIFSEQLQKYQYLRRKWSDEEGYRRLVWDETLNSTYSFIMPLNYLWATRLAFKYVPKFLLLPYVSSFLYSAAKDVHLATSSYWLWTTGVMGVDAGISTAYGYFADSSRTRSLDLYNYTDAQDRTAIDYNDYLAQRSYFDSERAYNLSMLHQDLFWLAFPWMVSPIMKLGYQLPYEKYVHRNETQLEKAIQDGDRLTAERIETRFEMSTKNRFNYITNTLLLEFKALGVEPGTYTPSRLDEAMQEIRKNGDPAQIARAERAYKRILNETHKALQLYSSSDSILKICTNTIFGSESETQLFLQRFNEFNSQPGGGT